MGRQKDRGLEFLDVVPAFSSPLLNSDTQTNAEAAIFHFGKRRVRIHDGGLQTANRYDDVYFVGLASDSNFERWRVGWMK